MGFIKVDPDEFSDGDRVVGALNELDRITGADLALLKNPAIKTHPTGLLETHRKVRAFFHAHR